MHEGGDDREAGIGRVHAVKVESPIVKVDARRVGRRVSAVAWVGWHRTREVVAAQMGKDVDELQRRVAPVCQGRDLRGHCLYRSVDKVLRDAEGTVFKYGRHRRDDQYRALVHVRTAQRFHSLDEEGVVLPEQAVAQVRVRLFAVLVPVDALAVVCSEHDDDCIK